MAGLCKAILIGNLGRDPEMRYTPSGKPVTSFSVACSRSYTSADGERKEETEWFRVSAWGRLGEVASQYLKKGSKVYLEGRIQTRNWTDQEGQKRFQIEVVASDLQMLDTRPRGDAPEVTGEEHAATDMNEIPF